MPVIVRPGGQPGSSRFRMVEDMYRYAIQLCDLRFGTSSEPVPPLFGSGAAGATSHPTTLRCKELERQLDDAGVLLRDWATRL